MEKHEKTQAREIALKILYGREFNKKKIDLSIKETTYDYVNQLLNGIKKNKDKIDDLIKNTSQSWTIERISLVDLNIMRMAVYEMLYSSPPVPFKVCIDEAIKIAKLYGTEDSAKFINGNLDTISKKIQTGS